MAYKLHNDASYQIEIENAKGEVFEISFDATDLSQVQALVDLMSSFDDTKQSLTKRLNKAEKEYEGERAIITQQLRIANEELGKIDERIDVLFGEGIAEKLFTGSRSIIVYLNFFKMLEKEFQPAIEKGSNKIDELINKYDQKVKDDEVL